MKKLIVNGAQQLYGEVCIGGAKNAAVAIIPATVLARGCCVLENVPDIHDTELLFSMLRAMGATVEKKSRTSVVIDTSTLTESVVPYELAKHMRASYYFIGSLLGRFGQACVSMPGGCNFGVRPIDQHIKGFEMLGDEIRIENGLIYAETEGMQGAHIYFDQVSVGATINVMLAAVKARGMTVLENVAKEPHIVDLANFLNSMGADIRGAGTDVIKIRGVDVLHGTDYSIIPDQIEAGTYMAAAAAVGGDVLVKNVIPKHLEPITAKLREAGAVITEGDDWVRVVRTGELHKINLKTLPHPGFPTDMQPQMAAMLTCAEGTSIITEGVWDNRFRYTEQLVRMGARITVDGKVAVIEGVQRLQGAPVKACDLRGGAAVIIAGLMAKGTTEIEDTLYIERGYENVVEKFTGIGADIHYIMLPEQALPEQA